MNIREEWNEKLAQQLVKNAHQPHILQFTPNDAAGRFASLQAALTWYQKVEKHTFPLWDGDELLGFIWFSRDGHEGVPSDVEYTFAIRMYEAGRGKGLAEDFAQAAIKQMDRYHMGSVWLETGADNEVAQHLYKKLGFEEIETRDGRVLMMLRKKPN